MISMNTDGTLGLEGEIQKYLTVPCNNILGKVLKVIAFNDSERQEKVMKILNIPWLQAKSYNALAYSSNQKQFDTEKIQ